MTETEAFCRSLVEDTEVLCTGIDGLVALVMSLAADKSAAEGRWVKFSEITEQVYCSSPTESPLLAQLHSSQGSLSWLSSSTYHT